MINIYLVIILCALLLANAGFFCDHHSTPPTEQIPVITKQQTRAVQESSEKDKLTELESRLEQLSQELTGVSKAVNKLTTQVNNKSH